MNTMNRRKDVVREERRVVREQREDAAGKLLVRIPDLTSLSLIIHEARPDGVVTDTRYTRRVVVEHAPALFEIPCSYPQCLDGGYDLTREVLSALASHELSFEGEQACRGRCGTLDCTRVLRYSATATYRDGPLAIAHQRPATGAR